MEDNGIELPAGLGAGLTSSQNNPTITPNGGEQQNGSKYASANDEAAKVAALKAEQEKAVKEAEEKRIAEEAAKKGEAEEGQKEQIDIDGVIFDLDKEGNAVDKNGKVFKTAKELEELIETSSDEPPLIEDIIKQSGVEIKDENGVPVVFEDSVEGIIKFSNALAEKKAVELFNKNIEADEELKKFIEARKRGVTLQDYATRETQSWQKVKINDKDESQQMDIVIADLLMSGMSEAQAKVTAEMYKETNRLKEFSPEALKRLQNYEIETEREEKEAFENNRKQAEKNRKDYWDNVNNIIKTGKVGNFTIPENLREPFFKYIAVAVKDGKSQAVIDESESVERLLEMRLGQFMKFDFSKLIQNAAKTLKAKSLKERIKVRKDMDGGEGINKNNYGKSSVDKFPTLEKLLGN